MCEGLEASSSLTLQHGITFIQIPYWWDRSSDHIRELLKEARPEIQMAARLEEKKPQQLKGKIVVVDSNGLVQGNSAAFRRLIRKDIISGYLVKFECECEVFSKAKEAIEYIAKPENKLDVVLVDGKQNHDEIEAIGQVFSYLMLNDCSSYQA